MTIYINCSNGEVVSQKTETSTAKGKDCECGKVIYWNGLTRQWS